MHRVIPMNQGGTADKYFYSPLTESIFLSRAFYFITPLTEIKKLKEFSFLGGKYNAAYKTLASARRRTIKIYM